MRTVGLSMMNIWNHSKVYQGIGETKSQVLMLINMKKKNNKHVYYLYIN